MGASVLIAGGTGLVGQRLSHLLVAQGYEVLHLSRSVRPNARFTTYQWDVANQQIDKEAILAADYVINLAGAGIVDARWTASRKKLIIDSRVDSTRLLRRSFYEYGKKPAAYLSAAAIGYYGDRGEQLLSETDAPGEGFLAESCLAWEEAIQEVEATGIRTVAIRIGIVLSVNGGAMEKMIQPIRLGMGGYFGDGKAWYSWIHIDDLCRMFIYAMEQQQVSGIYNGVGPHPERNKNMVATMAKAINRPAILVPAPSFALRLAMGEMASTILNSTKVDAAKIEATGFHFQFPDLYDAVKDLVNRKI